VQAFGGTTTRVLKGPKSNTLKEENKKANDLAIHSGKGKVSTEKKGGKGLGKGHNQKGGGPTIVQKKKKGREKPAGV